MEFALTWFILYLFKLAVTLPIPIYLILIIPHLSSMSPQMTFFIPRRVNHFIIAMKDIIPVLFICGTCFY